MTNIGPARLDRSSEMLSDPGNALDQETQPVKMEEQTRTDLGVPACTGVLLGAEILLQCRHSEGESSVTS